MRKPVAILAMVLSACGGEMGPPGPVGPQGPAGPRGAPGEMYVQTLRCTVITTPATFTIERFEYSDGSVLVHCGIDDAAITIDSMALYRSTQAGSQNGLCIVTDDVDTPNFGYWVFTASKGATAAKAVYTNTGSSSDGTSVTMPCQVN